MAFDDHRLTGAALPLSLALPAAAASLAYVNAKTGLWYDLEILSYYLPMSRGESKAFAEDKANLFYLLETRAFASETANRSFIAVPPPIPKEYTQETLKTLKTEEWSYRQVYDIVLRYAAWLKRDYDISKGDIVALDFGNKPQFIFLWYAIWSLGARPAFINTGLRGTPLLHCIRTSSSKILLLDPSLQDVLSANDFTELLKTAGPEKTEVAAVVVDQELEQQISRLAPFRAENSARSVAKLSDMAVLIFTSGTTGLPKPAVCTWRRFIGAPIFIGKLMKFKPNERYYTALPLYHSSASQLAVSVCLGTGTTCIISPHFSPSTFFASVAASRATTIQYIGEMCRYLISTPPSLYDTKHSVVRAFGNGLRPDVWQTFKDRFAIDEIYEFYGATESPASTFVYSRNSFGRGAIGRGGILSKLIRGNQSALVRHDVETGEPWRHPTTGLCAHVAVNEPGELLSALDPNDIGDKYHGYWGNEKASSSKILRDVFKKGDAYFRTGDLIRTDSEGRTFFVDRIGDTFRWKGENVSTSEVELALAGHLLIKEANVYGVQLPAHDGRAGCAAVTLAGTPTEDTLTALAREMKIKLPKFAVPLFLRKVQTMEMTGTTKYTKNGLRTQGVDPGKVGSDRLYWLDPKSGSYKEFGQREWDAMVGGQIKL